MTEKYDYVEEISKLHCDDYSKDLFANCKPGRRVDKAQYTIKSLTWKIWSTLSLNILSHGESMGVSLVNL